MSLRDQPAQNLRPEEENEAIVIDWQKVLQFFLRYYRYLLIGAFGGALLNLAIAVAFQSNDIQLYVPNVFKVDFENYRELTFKWTARAQYIAKQDSYPPADRVRYERFSNQIWINQHIIPVYSITNSDLKARVGIIEPMGKSIIGMQLKISTKDIDEGNKELLLLRQFIYSASTYDQVSSLLQSYEQKNMLSLAQISKEMNTKEISLVIKKRELVHLEGLHKSYSGSTPVANQVIDPKDSAAKYLPIITQLIAVKNDIFALNEALVQLHNKNRQSKFVGQFLREVKPILIQEQDGLNLTVRILEVAANLQKALSPNDQYLNETLNAIQIELLSIQSLLLLSANELPMPTIIPTLNISKSVALGFFGGGLLALLICLGLYSWPGLKRVIAKAQ